MFQRRTRVIVSAKYRLAYLRVPKVTNTSIRRALSDGRRELITVQRLPKHYPDYVSFTFVRNPWDRLVSAWGEKIRTEKLNDDHFIDGVHRNFVKLGFPFGAGMPFGEFAEFACSLSDAKTEKHLKSQCWFVVRRGSVAADFVGRSESMREDWGRLCDRVGASIELGHYKESRRGSYQDYYDDALRDRVGARYREDAEMFGYRFED
jgi:hypothetical protein